MKKQLPYLLLPVVVTFNCREHYFPPVVKKLGATNYLVVEGFINVGQDTTRIMLSRTKKITDSTQEILPEEGAVITVQSDDGNSYPLREDTGGVYLIPHINGSTASKYRLAITTANGKHYNSLYVEFKQTPPIDSVTWQQQNDGVHIYVSAHDNTGNTKYYRWSYIETWEYHAAFTSVFKWGPYPVVLLRNKDEFTFKCYHTIDPGHINLFNTLKLSDDVVYKKELLFIANSHQKLRVRYSVLVKQYALTADSYNYWQQLQDITENKGSIFDAQPAQLTGNIINDADPTEVVLGFVTASGTQQQRIMISRAQLGTWPVPQDGCDTIHIRRDYAAADALIPLSPELDSYYGYNFASPYCTDCTLQGGTLTKPSFWP